MNTDIKLDYISLYTQFKRLQEQVLKETGISKKGANISGISEELSPYQVLMINMAEDARDVLKEKKKTKLQENLQPIKHSTCSIITEDSDCRFVEKSFSNSSSLSITPPNDSIIINRVHLDSFPEIGDVTFSNESTSSSISKAKPKAKKRSASFMEHAAQEMFEDPEFKRLKKIKLEKEIKWMEWQQAREDRLLKLQENQLEFQRQESAKRAAEHASTQQMNMLMMITMLTIFNNS